MGVPSFYRWLVKKYPNTVANAIEEEGDEAGGGSSVVDSRSSRPNPNGFEFDNLYLDMNAIIHPCFHPVDHPTPPTTFQEVFDNIRDYIDHLFCIVRPRKLLYMAIDGVAPRAKMNQQRSRRFRTSKDNEIAEAEERKLRTEFEMAGKPVLPKQESEVSDSNIITPGTEFMDELSKDLKLYINQRLETDAGWKKIKVILSDSNVPGEGEHKITSFIRLQRASPGYDPNTRHCLYGLDADLIMLALATHELHFSILREVCDIQEQQPHLAIETSLNKAEPSSLTCRGPLKQQNSAPMKQHYQFLHIWILREYLQLDLTISEHPSHVKIDLERLIDDFIFICLFTGNDFLPHMPTLEIHEGAIDLLMHVYVKEFKNLGGYLVDMQWAGYEKGRFVRLKRVEKFILSIGAYEEKIFKKRSEIQDRKLKRLLPQYSDDKEEEQEQEQERGPGVELQHCAAKGKAPTSQKIVIEAIESPVSSKGTTQSTNTSEILQNTRELKEKLKSCIQDRSDLFKNGNFTANRVKLGVKGWHERYYMKKFSAKTKEDIEITRKAVVQRYTEGLCWSSLYYFSGVPSWKWFYPYHYGPFASDLRGLSQVKVNFDKGSPFKPFDQLMGVLPPRSSHALPRVYRPLMTSEESEIIDFYPTNFQLDEEGKRFTWQAICKLPFIDEERLLFQTNKAEAELRDDEAERNSTKVDILFVRSSEEQLGSQIFTLYRKQHEGGETDTAKESIGADLGCGLSGFISPCNEYPWECDEGGRANNILFVMYELPNECQHIPRLLQGVNIPEKTITEGDIVETQLWHDTSSSRGQTTASSSSWDPRGRNAYPVTHRGACNLDENWKSSCSAQFEDFRISDSSQGFKSFERGRTANFQSYGNSLVADRSGDQWRQSSCGQLLGAPFSQGGRQISGSVRGTSAGIPSHHAWQHNLSPLPAPSMQGQGWRQSSLSVQGTSAGRTSHHAWQHNLSPPPAPSMQGRGWRQVVQGHNWQHNVRPPNAPSMQGSGWRQSGGNVRGMSARSTTSQQAWRHNPAPPSAPSMQAHGRGQFTSSAAPRDWEVRDTP
ncbi:5'-3' exoribonuclease 3-like isoform X1 [Rhododendron vialii]|uniref:5'-3' exoribonuclease 3-like isoform X1 n=1 Tax=Rhododendron vialii TaxID=182163 RepID=UPI00265F3415|nr:5'-3' exoribonuclease 3-like isoform X1 [Rhododendron vialii]